MKTKITALFAVLVLTLAIAGTSYAAWTSSVKLIGNAEVGNIDFQVLEVTVADETSPGAFVSAVVDGDKKTVTITLDDVYPGYSVDLDVNLHNAGSLPLYYSKFQLTSWDNPALAAYFGLAFYDAYPTSKNVDHTFPYYTTQRDYLIDFLIPPDAVTLEAGESGVSTIQVYVLPTLPNGYMTQSLSVTFQLTAALKV